jgi:Fe-S-cluster containining protein
VFTDDGDWYLLVHTVCKHLQSDQRCGIYHTRPQICRDYSTKNCEYEDSWTYERYFETPEQVEEYMEAVLAPKPGTSIRSPKRRLTLPVVA